MVFEGFAHGAEGVAVGVAVAAFELADGVAVDLGGGGEVGDRPVEQAARGSALGWGHTARLASFSDAIKIGRYA